MLQEFRIFSLRQYWPYAFMLTRYDARSRDLPLLYRVLLTRPDWHLVYADTIAIV